ncbi:MAG: TIGR04211 family SH3 domain-containing protein [Gammaproteobacteria bacterium]|nr:TIGR04211 family SH3 domain-containing protein [Gammaproteobacteria bacterium]MCP5137690.1 TIGR04211 family SH3 domain-containing protein [Gammaproteobacteria bacterium]
MIPSSNARLPFLALLLISVLPAQAATRYVTDALEITLRAGNSTQHKITRMLKSGTPLQVQEEADGWAHVSTPDGRDGWVLSRFLIDEPIARERLEVAEKQLAQFRTGGDSLRRDFANLQTQNQQLLADNASLSAQKTQLEQDLKQLRTDTADTLGITRSNRLLKAKVVELEKHVAGLEAETNRLRDATASTWFLYGAGVIFGGILLGLILPRVPLPRRKRRGMWDTL